MRLGLIANYSRSVEKSYPRRALLPSGAKAAPFFAVREADKPADADYPFGHAKIEAVAALAQTGFLVALSVGVAVQAIERKRGAATVVDANAFAFAFAVAVVVFHRRGSHALAGPDPCCAPDLAMRSPPARCIV
jgi:Cation efflux family